MPIQQTDKKVVFHEQLPRRFFVFISMFIILGGIAMVGISAYAFFYFTDQPKWALVGCGLIGILFILHPFLEFFSSSHTTTLDFSLRKVTIKKRSVIGNSVKVYNFENINRFIAEEDMDYERPFDRWGIQMELKTGKQIQLPNSWVQDENLCGEIAQSANGYLAFENKI